MTTSQQARAPVHHRFFDLPYDPLNGLIPQSVLAPITKIAALLTTVAMGTLGLGVDVRVLACTGARLTFAVIISVIVLGSMSYGLIRLVGMP